MNILTHPLLIALTLASCISLSHDTSSSLSNLQKTKQQIKIEDQMAEKKSDLKFNTVFTALGAGLLCLGLSENTNPNSRSKLISYALGIVFTGAGTYFGAKNVHKIQQLKEKLATCDTTAKS